MEQAALFTLPAHWTVTELTRHVRARLESDPELQSVWVQGEISNLSRPSSGHIYFTLKDAGASLRCVIWRSGATRLKFAPQDGVMVEAHGEVGVYETGGQYQLYVDGLQPLGEGALFAEFLRLKALLEAEGLFDPTRKRPIPELPRRIGIITSPSGAALQDMLKTLRRRLPLAEVVLAPSPVQGAEAPAALVAALAALNRAEAPDVILLGRGGGSIEDLWAFNDERLVRAVRASAAPVISGVGHETDFTLVDFAADLRAATPTAAAEMATPLTVQELRLDLESIRRSLAAFQAERLGSARSALGELRAALAFFTPLRRVQDERQRVDEQARRAGSALLHRLGIDGERLHGLEERLAALSPLSVLGRGYALVSGAAGVIHSVSQVQAGELLQVRLHDGAFHARVTEEKVNNDEK